MIIPPVTKDPFTAEGYSIRKRLVFSKYRQKVCAAAVLGLSILTLAHAEQADLGESPASQPVVVTPGAPLETFLPHTVWHPSKKNQPWRSITFTTDGRMHFALENGGGMIHYTLSPGSDSIICRFSQDQEFQVSFSKDRQSMTLKGETFTLQPNLHSKFSDLVRKP